MRRVKKVEHIVKNFSANIYYWELETVAITGKDRVIGDEPCAQNSGIIKLEDKGIEPEIDNPVIAIVI